MCRRNADSLSHTFAATPDFLIPTQLKTRFIFQMLHYLVLGSSTTKFLSSNVVNKIKVKVIKLIDVVGICSGTSVCALRLVGVTGRWLDFQFDRLACFDQSSPSHIRGGCRLLARSTSRIPRMFLCTCWHMQPGKFCQHNICMG